MRASSVERHGYAALAPDVVAEILSPGDRAGDVLEKVAEWLRAGSCVVWVVDAERRLAQVHRADGTIGIVHGEQSLGREDVLPGFNCPLRDILRTP